MIIPHEVHDIALWHTNTNIKPYPLKEERVNYSHIKINEHKNTNMFMLIIIYFTNIFEDKHIFLVRCLHHNLATSRTIIKKIMNRNSFDKNNACLKNTFNRNYEQK